MNLMCVFIYTSSYRDLLGQYSSLNWDNPRGNKVFLLIRIVVICEHANTVSIEIFKMYGCILIGT